jgi:hypothetical protein
MNEECGSVGRSVDRGGEHAALAGTRAVAGLGRIAAAASLRPAQANGYAALIIRFDGEVDTVLAARIDDGIHHRARRRTQSREAFATERKTPLPLSEIRSTG